MADREAVSAAVDGLPDGFAAVDVLVNNAGLARGLEPAQSAALDDWDAMVDTNVKGLMYVHARACCPGWWRGTAGTWSTSAPPPAEWPYPGGNVYGATKAFVAPVQPQPPRRPAGAPRCG